MTFRDRDREGSADEWDFVDIPRDEKLLFEPKPGGSCKREKQTIASTAATTAPKGAPMTVLLHDWAGMLFVVFFVCVCRVTLNGDVDVCLFLDSLCTHTSVSVLSSHTAAVSAQIVPAFSQRGTFHLIVACS